MTALDLGALLRAGVRPVPDWPGYYATADGHILSTRAPGRPPRILRTTAHYRTGHLRVGLYRGGRATVVRCYVHRLVALAWHGPPPGGPADGAGWSVLHGDDDPGNNAPANLTWGTEADNQADRNNARARDLAEGAALGVDWATHEHCQAYCGRRGVYLADPRWGF